MTTTPRAPDLDLTPEAVERLCQMLLAVDKSRHGYTGHPRYNRDGMNAEQVIRALSEKLAKVEAERETLTTSGIIEVAVRNPSVMEYMKHWEARAEAAEAALATARAGALREAAEICDDLAIGYAKHVGVPTALLDAKRDILALIPQEKPNE